MTWKHSQMNAPYAKLASFLPRMSRSQLCVKPPSGMTAPELTSPNPTPNNLQAPQTWKTNAPRHTDWRRRICECLYARLYCGGLWQAHANWPIIHAFPPSDATHPRSNGQIPIQQHTPSRPGTAPRQTGRVLPTISTLIFSWHCINLLIHNWSQSVLLYCSPLFSALEEIIVLPAYHICKKTL